MDKTQVVNALISNQATKWSDSDREFLMGLDEAQLAKFEPVANEQKPEVPEGGVTPAPAPAPEAPAANKAQTTAEYLQNMPAEIAQVVNSAMAQQAQLKATNIATIKANAQNQFTDAQLAAMTGDQIGLIAGIAANAAAETPGHQEIPLQMNYSGQAPVAPVGNEGAEAEEPMVMPVINYGNDK